ncbi:hypothetical protein V8E52_009302, partial [Russula decolorans]
MLGKAARSKKPTTSTARRLGGRHGGTNTQHVSKKARVTSARPLQLEFAEGDVDEGQLQGIDNNSKGKAKAKASKHPQPQPLKQMSSYYPGRGQDVVLQFSNRNPSEIEAFSDSNCGDTDIDSEEEWLTVPQPQETGAKNTSKASTALVIERPIWNHSVPTTVSSGASSSALALLDHMHSSSQESSSDISHPAIAGDAGPH